MEQIEGEIFLNYTDSQINTLVASLTEGEKGYSRHFNQNEEFFIKLDREFTVPSFPVHHDVKLKKPESGYLDILREFLGGLVPLAPQVFSGLTYFFDPAEILRPCFFQIYRYKEKQYLYLLRLDLMFRTHEGEMLEQGTNDRTSSYTTSKLFLEGDIIPLEGIRSTDGKLEAFKVNQTVSQTWIGETGRGYFVQGIWMDNELTKFFSKLFLPAEKRTYPYYPFMCKYRTITYSLIELSPEGRKKYLPFLVQALDFIEPSMEKIQDELRDSKFSTELAIFGELKKNVPEGWGRRWDSFQVKRYLNDRDMKEYGIEL